MVKKIANNAKYKDRFESVDQAKDEIIEWISHGKTLRAFCAQDKSPSWRCVYFWLDDDPEFASRFTKAREQGTDALAEEMLDLMDETPPQGADGKIDPAYVSWMRNRANFRMMLLGKWNSGKYGNRIDFKDKEANNFAINIVGVD